MVSEVIIHTSNEKERDKSLIAAGFFYDFGDQVTAYLPVEAEGLTIGKDGKFLTCTLMTEEQKEKLAKIAGIQILGEYDDIFGDPTLLKIYDSIYDRSEQKWVDEDGTEHKYTPPAEFATFGLPEPDPAEVAAEMKAKRDVMLNQTVEPVMAHQEQKTLGVQPDMSEPEFKQTLAFRQQLRAMFKPKAAYFSAPAGPVGYSTRRKKPSWEWPTLPDVLKDQFPDYPPK